eukprot:CAMPEP_0172607650 /NCGR_PEP_ID=MMETSP1068-20121228/27808_1 /TAXON_ID=35684 /ORGANISM="Pseudopedinella elastica, Strain CCMP716" /LENGTH=573 /DNA_ID=CAMNT_0013410715 /DNA_START=147 /DNA_END=1868 /DNA_ORIENTATION=+
MQSANILSEEGSKILLSALRAAIRTTPERSERAMSIEKMAQHLVENGVDPSLAASLETRIRQGGALYAEWIEAFRQGRFVGVQPPSSGVPDTNGKPLESSPSIAQDSANFPQNAGSFSSPQLYPGAGNVMRPFDAAAGASGLLGFGARGWNSAANGPQIMMPVNQGSLSQYALVGSGDGHLVLVREFDGGRIRQLAQQQALIAQGPADGLVPRRDQGHPLQVTVRAPMNPGCPGGGHAAGQVYSANMVYAGAVHGPSLSIEASEARDPMPLAAAMPRYDLATDSSPGPGGEEGEEDVSNLGVSHSAALADTNGSTATERFHPSRGNAGRVHGPGPNSRAKRAEKPIAHSSEVESAVSSDFKDSKTCCECAKAKVKCDKATPSCSRCARIGCECIPQLRGRGRPRKAEDGAGKKKAGSFPPSQGPEAAAAQASQASQLRKRKQAPTNKRKADQKAEHEAAVWAGPPGGIPESLPPGIFVTDYQAPSVQKAANGQAYAAGDNDGADASADANSVVDAPVDSPKVPQNRGFMSAFFGQQPGQESGWRPHKGLNVLARVAMEHCKEEEKLARASSSF